MAQSFIVYYRIKIKSYNQENYNRVERDHLPNNEVSKITYCGDFTNNLLVIGQAGSGKTSFVESILANGFVKSDDIIWISSEELPDDTRSSYHDCFKCFENFSFYLVSSAKDVNRLLLNLLPEIKNRHVHEKRKTVMVLDDLLNIADKSDEYTRFLANRRHYGVMTINIFQAFRGTDRWDNIKSNCQMIVLFKMALKAVRAISQVANIIVGHNEGVPKKESWLYRLFVDVVISTTTYGHLLFFFLLFFLTVEFNVIEAYPSLKAGSSSSRTHQSLRCEIPCTSTLPK